MKDWNDAHVNGHDARSVADAAWTSRAHARDGRSSTDPALSGTRDENACGLSDCDLSDLLAAQQVNNLRYVAPWGTWFYYDGKVWKRETTHLARSLAKVLCQEVAINLSEADARRIASAKTVAGIQTLAASDRRLAATVDQWDANPWLLNTPDGVVDLHTGLVHPHRPDDHMSKITAVAPSGDCPQCSRSSTASSMVTVS